MPSAIAHAADLPPIKVTAKNPVPECATPGRLMAFIRSRNSKLEPRLEKIAVEYMRRGEELGLRWDYAFIQMAIETSYLTYQRANGRRGDVKPTQNNFAGLGATGGGEPGESFADMPTGVLAHLQHIAVYAGDDVEDPVADRTRKIKQWGIGAQLKRTAKGGVVTYNDLARRWATGRDYADAIETHAERFYDDFCKKDDPNPELVAEARGAKEPASQEVAEARISGKQLARKAIEDGRAEGDTRRRGLGAKTFPKPQAEAEEEPAPAQKKSVAPSYSVLNAPGATARARPDKPPRPEALRERTDETEPATREESRAKPERTDRAEKADKAERSDRSERSEKSERRPPVTQAAAAAGSLAKTLPPVPAGTKCRVFTASYGGQRAVLIRAQSDGGVNYTVLDVNEGSEKREADAYIAAYARSGGIAGEFTSQTQALDKAFELCPEG
jgi:hypothetical protein